MGYLKQNVQTALFHRIKVNGDHDCQAIFNFRLFCTQRLKGTWKIA